jgi:hypothetical protein
LRPATASTVNGPRDNDRFGDLISADAISQTPPELQAVAQPAPERERFSAFARAHGSRGVALRRDECGDCRINGSRGHVYAAPEGFQIFVGWSANGRNRAKRPLSFAQIRNDGDDEGRFLLDRSSTAVEGDLIRHWLGIAKKAEFSGEELACKRGPRARSLRVKPDGWVEEPAGIASDEAAATQVAKPGGERNFTAIVEGST